MNMDIIAYIYFIFLTIYFVYNIHVHLYGSIHLALPIAVDWRLYEKNMARPNCLHKFYPYPDGLRQEGHFPGKSGDAKYYL